MKQNKIQIPEGYKNSALGIIPNDWEVKRLGEVFSQVQSFSFSRDQMTEETQQLHYIHYGDIHSKEAKDSIDLRRDKLPFVFDGIISQEKQEIGTFPKLNNGDILLTDASEDYDGVGKSLEIINTDNKKIIGGLHTIVLRSKINNIFIGFGRYIFRNELGAKSIKRIAQGTKVYSISYNSISKLNLLLPPLPQQQKIAEILGTWDEAIEKQSQLIDKLTDRKRGLMQQLLTGKKRLAGFSEEWKEVRLGEIGETFTGLTGKTKDNFGTGDPFITYMNVYNSYQINTTQMGYVCLEKGELQNLVKYGDIFFTISSETPHEVGMSSVLLDEIENTYLNSFCFGYRLYDFTTFIPEFAKYYLRSKGVRLEMYKLAQGSTRFNLSKSEVLKIKVILPSLPEQTAIANILTAADKEIELAKSKLELLRSQKSGLMQELLTGKTRVKIN